MEQQIDVKALRASLKMTQAEFGSAVGVDQSTVSLWETGNTTPRGSARKLIEMLATASHVEIAKPGAEAAQ